jgi:hypothetical protein
MIKITRAKGNWCNCCDAKKPTFVKEIFLGSIDQNGISSHGVAANLCQKCMEKLKIEVIKATKTLKSTNFPEWKEVYSFLLTLRPTVEQCSHSNEWYAEKCYKFIKHYIKRR